MKVKLRQYGNILNVTKYSIEGNGVKAISRVVVATVPTAGTYFRLYAANGDMEYYVVCKVDGVGAYPVINPAIERIIPVALTTGMTATQIGDAIVTALTNAALDPLLSFTAVNTTGTVNITRAVEGPVVATVDGATTHATGFTITEPTAGTITLTGSVPNVTLVGFFTDESEGWIGNQFAPAPQPNPVLVSVTVPMNTIVSMTA